MQAYGVKSLDDEVSTGSGSDWVSGTEFSLARISVVSICDPVATAPGTDLINHQQRSSWQPSPPKRI